MATKRKTWTAAERAEHIKLFKQQIKLVPGWQKSSIALGRLLLLTEQKRYYRIEGFSSFNRYCDMRLGLTRSSVATCIALARLHDKVDGLVPPRMLEKLNPLHLHILSRSTEGGHVIADWVRYCAQHPGIKVGSLRRDVLGAPQSKYTLIFTADQWHNHVEPAAAKMVARFPQVAGASTSRIISALCELFAVGKITPPDGPTITPPKHNAAWQAGKRTRVSAKARNVSGRRRK